MATEGVKSGASFYSREVRERVARNLKDFSEPVWDAEILGDWSWAGGQGKQSELASVVTVDAFCGEGQHKERYKTFMDTYAIVTSLLLTIVAVQIIQPPDFNSFRDSPLDKNNAVLNIHLALLVVSFSCYLLALMLTALTLEAMARTMTIRDYAVFIQHRGKLAAKVPKLFTTGTVVMVLSYVFLVAVVYSDASLVFMILGAIAVLVGELYFAGELQIWNAHLNPRHKQQYALVLELLTELAASHDVTA